MCVCSLEWVIQKVESACGKSVSVSVVLAWTNLTWYGPLLILNLLPFPLPPPPPPIPSPISFPVGSGSCRVGLIHFLSRWHQSPINQALVSFASVCWYASSFLALLFRFLSFSIVITFSLWLFCHRQEIGWEDQLFSPSTLLNTVSAYKCHTGWKLNYNHRWWMAAIFNEISGCYSEKNSSVHSRQRYFC